ncbi:MAG TPA: metallophosphoesterase [Bdellovibrionales bacterium]|nr:metallophosphoesterase [Bdellovibrionales bacterium]
MKIPNTDVRRLLGGICLLLTLSTELQARPVQIIHTNDLHSHMDYAGSKPDRGGYAAVKVVIDKLRAQAAERGIPTLVLDGGDFSEGTHFYLADEGLKSWEALDQIGYDAVALGNHDYQVGPKGLEHILSRLNPKAQILGANFRADREYGNVNRVIKKSAEFVRDGIRIAVLGLTTNEFFYRWTAKPGGDVKDPIETAKKLVPALKKRNDFVIALTHIGTKADTKLVENVPGVDVVVGGHDHAVLYKPLLVAREKGPIAVVVQAGEHGKYVGDMLLDLERGSPARVLRYRLIDVITGETGVDPNVQQFVASARQAIDDRYGRGWLDEVIGQTDIPMDRPVKGTTPWSRLFVQTYREATGADLAWDVGEFYGPSQTAGDITREKLIRYFPRVFDIKNPNGWTIWTMKLQGKAITEIIKQSAKQGFFFNLDGITYKTKIDQKGKFELTDFKIGGKKVSPFKVYKIATSEGLGRGTAQGHWLAKAFAQPKDSGIPIWSAVESRLRSVGNLH